MNRFQTFITFLLFVLSFLMLVEVISPSTFPEPRFDMSDDGQRFRDTQDRRSLAAIFSPYKITFNKTPNAYYAPVDVALFNFLYFIDKELSFSIYTSTIIIHLINGVVLLLILRLFIPELYISWIGCGVFLFFPSSLNMLKWLSAGFNHSFITLLCLSTTFLWIRFIQTRRLIYFFSSLLICIIAFATKPLSYFIPFSLIAIIFFPLLRDKNNTIISTKNLFPFSLYYLVSLFPFLIIKSFKYPQGAIAREFGGIELGFHPLIRITDLLGLLITQNTFNGDMRLIAGMILLLFLLICLIYSVLNKEPILFFWLSWIFGSCILFLTSNFRDIETVSRYHYFPLCGLIFIFSYSISKLTTQVKRT
jgi:hypothetical protein